ncbi:MAG: DEAD/DEAH box helicase, partial [Gammaproteobacteria bacterium]|nr:DEAD/DEAH box helicase [Gammaproteobacteria bacterium]
MKDFTKTTRRWFADTFAAPTAVQEAGWKTIASGRNALLIAPTGSGKTLAAFLYSIDRLIRTPRSAQPGVKVLYISPLKALVYDVERNLRGPLAGIRVAAETAGEVLPEVRVDVRTGDTPQKDRQRQRRDPGEILVTTPESLFLLLGSQARETLRTVETVIIDEVHALAPTKRGAHLALSLERLAALTTEEPQRIGLSATVRPRDVISTFLGGDRPVETVATGERPGLDIAVTVPVPDMEQVTAPAQAEQRSGPLLQLSSSQGGGTTAERGIWTALYPELLQTVRESTSTIIFVNSRGLCERLCQRLNDLAEEQLLRAHHGSVSHAKRAEIEDALKRGELKGIVATSSLELGIDMGAVDKVIMVESPGSVARGLQRAGRAGHQVGEVSVARIYPKFKADLLESALIAKRMQDGAIESVQALVNPLDVLAQQIIAMCVDQPRSPDEIAATIRRAQPFRDLSDDALHALLDMLTGRYPSSDFADLRPRLSWDRAKDRISARRGAAMITRLNSGTIPDRGNYGVHL